MKDLVGQTLGGYAVLEQLGAGGMGAVFKAKQPVLDRIVALKVIAPQVAQDSSFIARFQQEAKSAARLNHPNIVQVYAAGEENGTHFMVSEFVEGESLQQRLNHEGRMNPQEALAICVFVAEGLKHAWDEARIIHRDIKPANIFLSNKGAVKIGDLGLAKSVGGVANGMTVTGMMMGSPHYISPEQARALKDMDFRTDIYSLGCTLFHILSGKTPYEADEAIALILKHVNDPTPNLQTMLPTCPPALAALVRKMMAKDRNLRHESYEALISELRQVNDIITQQQLAATAVVTPAASAAKAVSMMPMVKQTVTHEGKPARGNWKLVIGGAMVTVTLLAGIFCWSPWRLPQNANAPPFQHPGAPADALKLPSNILTNPISIPDEPKPQKRTDGSEEVRATLVKVKMRPEGGVNDMKIAVSAEEYLKALRNHGPAGKSLSLQEARNAELVIQTLSSARQLLSSILMPHDAAGFEFYCKNPGANMMPANVTTVERVRFLSLRDDDNLRNVYKYDWMPRRAPNTTGQIAYSIGSAEEKSRIGLVSTYAGVFPYCPDGKLGVMSRGAGVKSPESELFARCRVGLLADGKGSCFTTPILQVIDAVDADTQASPLFKAYLQAKLYELMSLRPHEWGGHWVATLRADQTQLLGAGADGLQSDDWMQPEKNQSRMGRLEQYYLQRRNRLPYFKQAQAMRQLVSSVYSQHRYAGYVDMRGVPQMSNEIEKTGELWGLEQHTLRTALLFRADSSQQRWIEAHTAQPLTPLLLMPANKTSILEETARNVELKLDDSAARSWLPPFFSAN
jgi:hypothetical protein